MCSIQAQSPLPSLKNRKAPRRMEGRFLETTWTTCNNSFQRAPPQPGVAHWERGRPARESLGKRKPSEKTNVLVLRGFWWNPLWNSTNARIKKGDRTRPPPRGGWRGHEWKADAWQKTSGRGRDGGSTAVGRRANHDFPPPTKESISGDGPCESLHRQPPAVLPPPPFPSAPHSQSAEKGPDPACHPRPAPHPPPTTRTPSTRSATMRTPSASSSPISMASKSRLRGSRTIRSCRHEPSDVARFSLR